VSSPVGGEAAEISRRIECVPVRPALLAVGRTSRTSQYGGWRCPPKSPDRTLAENGTVKRGHRRAPGSLRIRSRSGGDGSAGAGWV